MRDRETKILGDQAMKHPSRDLLAAFGPTDAIAPLAGSTAVRIADLLI